MPDCTAIAASTTGPRGGVMWLQPSRWVFDGHDSSAQHAGSLGRVVNSPCPALDGAPRPTRLSQRSIMPRTPRVWTRLRIATNIRRVRYLRRFAFTFIAILVACDEGDVHFTTNFASDFTPGRHTVSVLGVYKDGRMSSSGWETLSPHVAPALGASHCVGVLPTAS